MADPSPMAENDAWLKGYEAGVAEGRRQGREIIEKVLYENSEGEWYALAVADQDLSEIVGDFMADTPPGEPTTQGTTGEGED